MTRKKLDLERATTESEKPFLKNQTKKIFLKKRKSKLNCRMRAKNY